MTCTPSSLPPTPRATRCSRRGDGRERDVARGEAGTFERGVPRRDTEGRVDDLAEALVPDPGAGLTRGAPPLDVLVGDARAPEQLGHDRAVVVAAHDERGGGVALHRFLGAAGEPGADVGAHDQRRGAAGQRKQEAADRGARRHAHVERRGRGGSCSAACTPVALVLSA